MEPDADRQLYLLTRWVNAILILCMLTGAACCVYVGVRYVQLFW
jgi:hypothetical protein